MNHKGWFGSTKPRRVPGLFHGGEARVEIRPRESNRFVWEHCWQGSVARSPRFPRGKRTPPAEAGQRSPSAVPRLARSARPPRSESHLHLGHGWMCLQPPSPPGAIVHLPQSRSLLAGEVTKMWVPSLSSPAASRVPLLQSPYTFACRSWCRRLRVHDRRRNKQTKRSHTTPRPLLALLWQGVNLGFPNFFITSLLRLLSAQKFGSTIIHRIVSQSVLWIWCSVTQSISYLQSA